MTARAWRSHEHVAEVYQAASTRESESSPRPSGVMCVAPKGGRMARYYGKAGDAYGDLTLRREWDRRRRGVRWLCDCVCGGTAIRFTSALNRAVRDGYWPTCARCRQDVASARKDFLRDALREAYRKQWVDTGTLWRPWQTRQLMTDVRDALARTLGEPTETLPAASDMRLANGYPWEHRDVGRAKAAMIARGRPDLAPDTSWIDGLYETNRGVSDEERFAIESLEES